MDNSDAVIWGTPERNAPPFLGVYQLVGGEEPNALNTTSFPLINASGETVLSNGGENVTTFKFEREINGSNVRLNADGPNYLLWAYARTGSYRIRLHGVNRGRFLLDFGSPAGKVVASALPEINKCRPSNLPGYSCQMAMGESLSLYWQRKAGGVAMAVRAAVQGWVGVAWSERGGMGESDSIIYGLHDKAPTNTQPTVGRYILNGEDSADPVTNFSMTGASALESNGESLFRFERKIGDGAWPIQEEGGLNMFLWAHSAIRSYVIDDHLGFEGRFPLELTAAPDATVKCDKSWISGYDCVYQASVNVTVHWRKNKDSVSFAMQSLTVGWAGIAFSASGRMSGSEAVIYGDPAGNTDPRVGAYVLQPKGVSNETKFQLLNAVGAVNASNANATLFRFERKFGEGDVPLKPYGKNYIIWAVSRTGRSRIGYHGLQRGRFTLDFGAPASVAAAAPLRADVNRCTASSLAGFNCMLRLSSTAVLYWQRRVGGLSLALQTSLKGYSGIGWSKRGGMGDSDAVVFGTLDTAKEGDAGAATVGTYYLDGEISANATDAFAITNASATSSETETLFSFDRSYDGKGVVPMRANELDMMLWAASARGSFLIDDHLDNEGRFAMEFTWGPDVVHPFEMPGVDSACTPSSIPDLQCSLAVSDTLTLHWKHMGPSVKLAVEAVSTGWVSLGWSPDGKMAPSDCVIGYSTDAPYVKEYQLEGYAVSDAKEQQQALMRDASITVDAASGKTILRYEKDYGAGAMAMQASGLNTMIWAFAEGDGDALAYHGNN
eukprot:jgi/Mesen1/2471/ME000158S01667